MRRTTEWFTKRTVARALIEVLAQYGVRRIYGLPGDSLNGITDAIRTHGAMEFVHVRHEETAAFAAGADAQLTGKLAVCMGSCGPGNTHLINGLYDCTRSRVPVLVIAAQIPSDEIGSNYFQETHPERIFVDCSVYVDTISHPSQVPRVFEIAIQNALSKQGVATIVIPGDVALQEATHAKPRVLAMEMGSTARPTEKALEVAAEILNAGKLVTILAGAGCAGAHDELTEVAERLKAPIVHTVRGKDAVEYEKPYDCGMTGLIGFSSGYHALKACDTLLMVGTDFPYRQFYPDDAKVVQIDLRLEQMGRRTKIHGALVGRRKRDAESALTARKREGRSCAPGYGHQTYAGVRKHSHDLAREEPGHKPIHPQFAARLINELAAEDAVFTCDVGTLTIWAARYLQMNGKRRLLGSFNHGSMANALPQAIGVQQASLSRQVISISGDGGLSMLLGELMTLKQQKLPVKVVVFSNGALAFVELEMMSGGIVTFRTDLYQPDFAKIADGSGILGIRVEDPADLRPALSKAFQYDGPALVEVLTARQELSMPPTITIDQAKGFSLWTLRTVISGRGDEVVDLARTNLWR